MVTPKNLYYVRVYDWRRNDRWAYLVGKYTMDDAIEEVRQQIEGGNARVLDAELICTTYDDVFREV